MKTYYHKKGDQVLCIKTMETQNIRTNYYKDKIYTITDISFNHFVCEFSFKINDQLWFNYNKDGQYYMKDYFITQIEQRKLKLLKLNQIR